MTLHIYNDIEQRSEEWHALRRGIVTASAVGKLVTVGPPDAAAVGCPRCQAKANAPCVSVASKARPELKSLHRERTTKAESLPPIFAVADNDTSRALTTTLAAERITGLSEQMFINDDMFRGIESEPYARDIYSGHYQQAVEVGFMLREEACEDFGWQLGLSPDGLVGDDGGIEIKAPRAKGHILTILADEVPPQHVPQCQAALLVSGRKWWDFVSYHAGLPLFVKRVYPDAEWFAAIKAACIEFEQKVQALMAEYEERIKGLPKTERIDLEVVI